MNIEKIAKFVASEPLSPSGARLLDYVGISMIEEFLRRCLAKIGEGVEPVAWVHEISTNNDEERAIVDFSPIHNLSVFGGDIPLYATPHEAILAAEKRVAEAFEKGKADGWEACETCHGIVDGKLSDSKLGDKFCLFKAVGRIIDFKNFKEMFGRSDERMVTPATLRNTKMSFDEQSDDINGECREEIRVQQGIEDANVFNAHHEEMLKELELASCWGA
jgi:hypothetical protein